MKRILLFIWCCLLAAGIQNVSAQGADSLFAFYSFEESGIDSMGHADLGFVNVQIVHDSLKGNVAEVIQDSTGWMYSMSPLLPKDLDEFTVSFWYFWEDSAGLWKQIFEFNNAELGDPASNHVYLSPNLWGNTFGVVYYGKNWDYVSTEPQLPDLQWQHVAMTMKDTIITLYVDGVEWAKDTVSTLPSELAVDTMFFFTGGMAGRSSAHDAKLDHLKIFHKALDPSTVALLAKEDEPWTNSLFALYEFEENGTDSMGNVDLGFVNVEVVDDSLKGNVAQVVQDSAGYMYSMSPLLPKDLDEFTVSFWYFWEDSAGLWKQIFEFNNAELGDPASNHVYLSPNLWGNTFGVVYYGKNWDYVSTEPQLPDLQWQHVAMTMKDTIITLYVDGVQWAMDTVSTLPSELAVDTFFFLSGGMEGRSSPHDAKMDHLKIFHKALDSSAIVVLAKEDKPLPYVPPPPPPEADSLYAYYAFEESGVDSMGNVDLGMVNVEIVWDTLKGNVAQVVEDSTGWMYAMAPLMPEDQDEFTVSCWYFYEDRAGAWKQVFEFNNTKGDNIANGTNHLYMSPNLWGNNYGVISNGKAWEWICNEPQLPDSTWYHLAVTQKDTYITVYLNGEVYAEGSVQTLPSEMAVDSFFFFSGGVAGRMYEHDAKMDHLKIFHKALDAATVKILSEENKPMEEFNKAKIYADATVWFPLDGNGNDSIGDNVLYLKDISFETSMERGGEVATMHHYDTAYMLAQDPLVTTDVFTFSTWFYWDSEYADWWQEITEWDNEDGTAHFYLSPRAGENYGLVTQYLSADPNWTATTDVKTLPTDQWLHLAFTYNEGDVTGYLNGAQAFQGHIEHILSEMNLVKFYFGTSIEPGRIYRPISGKYDDIALWEKILTSEQIFAIAHDTFPARPEVDPYVIELEDYTFGDWSTGTDGDIDYAYWGGTSASEAMHEESILYGIAKGGGTFTLWGHVKSDVNVPKPFFVSLDGQDDFYTVLDTVQPTTGWEWVELYKTPSLAPGSHTIRIAPGTADFMVDKLVFTSDWGYDPELEYTKTDTEAPTDPGELLISKVDSKSATIAWTASTDNVEVISYDIYSGDRIIAVSDVEAMKVSLMASSDYSLSVRAKDQQGNVSGRNAAKDVTTEDLILTVRFDETNQTMHHFGASDGWAIRWVANWPDAKRDSIAMLLFSQELYPDGSPKGIGLSNWRYQIGEGSADMEDPGFWPSYWFRLISSFLNSDGTYDFTKQAESDWFRDKALEAGVEYLTGWTTSPPPYMTKNGYTYRHDTTQGYNLAADKYDDYGEYLATIAKHFQDGGTPFVAVSPLNEPQWGWSYSHGNAVQSGSYATNSEIAGLVKAIDAKFTEHGVTAKILIPEAGMLNKLHSTDPGDPKTSNQIYAFWDPSSPEYVGDLTNLSKYVAGHSYYSNSDITTTVANRRDVLDKINAVNSDLSFWQTEYSMLSGAYQDGRIQLKPIDYSLWMARIIHIDVTEGGATGWDWWTALTRVPSANDDYRYGLMSWYPEPDDATHTDGRFEVMPNLWALGNFSRFVRPGSVRLSVERSDGASTVGAAYEQFMSAYVNEDSTKIIMVAVNYGNTPQNLIIDVANLPSYLVVEKVTPYVTSMDDNLKAHPEIEIGTPYLMPGSSIVTLVVELTNITAVEDIREKSPIEEASFKLYPNPAKDQAIVEFIGDPAENVRLIDMTGKIHLHREVNSGRVILNTSALKRGFYIIAVDFGYKTDFQKLSIIE